MDTKKDIISILFSGMEERAQTASNWKSKKAIWAEERFAEALEKEKRKQDALCVVIQYISEEAQ